MVYSEILIFNIIPMFVFQTMPSHTLTLVLSLVTLAVYMSASEIEVGCLFSFVKEVFLFLFFNRFDY